MHLTYYTADSALSTYTLNVWLVAFIVLILTVMCRLKHKRRKSETEPSRSDPSALRFGGFSCRSFYVCCLRPRLFGTALLSIEISSKRGKVVVLRNKERQA